MPSDVAIDSYNRLFVTSYRSSKVVVFGIDDYSEPVITVAVDVRFAKPHLKRTPARAPVKVYLEVPSDSAAKIATDSIVLQIAGGPGGAGATVHPARIKDLADEDEDGVPDQRIDFDREELLAVLAEDGEHAVEIWGQMVDGRVLTGQATVWVER